MNKQLTGTWIAVATSLLMVGVAAAAPVNGLTTFTSGTQARASEVNGNFTAVKTAVDDNNTRIGTLLTQLATLQATVTALQGTVTTLQTQSTTQQTAITTLQSQVTAQQGTIATLQSQLTNITPLNSVVSLSSLNGVPTVRFTNVNVQVVNEIGRAHV